MSTISLTVAKQRLKIIHDWDDDDVQQALDGAEQEALRFLNRDYLPTLPLDYPSSEQSEDIPSSEDPVVADVIEGVLLLTMANYEPLTPAEVEGYRKAALVKLAPYRVQMGI